MGILNLFATMPQVYSIWHGKDAAGVSTLSWGYYTVFTAVLLLYGWVHGAKPIIAIYAGSVILYGAIFIGSIIY